MVTIINMRLHGTRRWHLKAVGWTACFGHYQPTLDKTGWAVCEVVQDKETQTQKAMFLFRGLAAAMEKLSLVPRLSE